MKRLFIILFVLIPVFAFGQAAAERTYNNAVAKMESSVGMTTSSARNKVLREAISLFKKAKIGFDSQEKKTLCQSKITECEKLLAQRASSISSPKDDTNNKVAEQLFAQAQEFEKLGKLDAAIAAYSKASDAFVTDEKKQICSERIEFCKNPIVISESVLEIGSAAKDYTLTVKSISKEWKVSSDANWVTGYQANTNEKDNFIVHVDENPNSMPRGAELTIKCGGQYKSLAISQDGAINVSVSELLFSDKAERQIVAIETPADNWSVEAPIWLIVNVLDNGRFSVESETYKSKDFREGEIKIVCGRNEKVIPVIQAKNLKKAKKEARLK